ncbi:MAG: hypothetical protein ACK4E5_11930, partial [Erythrobacter cryptus]
TGATVVSTGATSVGTNLTVGGAASIGGNTSIGGTLGVTGLTSTNGIANTGTITSTGNITSGGTITGAALVSTGDTSVGANLTVGGAASIAGATSIGGALSVVGNYTTAAGNISTTTGQIRAGNVLINPSNNGKITGLTDATLSATSTDAVTGRQLNATNLALAALDARVTQDIDRLFNRTDKAYQGVAMAFAMNAAPLSLSNGEGGISGGVGVFEGEWGGAIRAQYVTDAGVTLGANFGFSDNSVGGAVGAGFKF